MIKARTKKTKGRTAEAGKDNEKDHTHPAKKEAQEARDKVKELNKLLEESEVSDTYILKAKKINKKMREHNQNMKDISNKYEEALEKAGGYGCF